MHSFQVSNVLGYSVSGKELKKVIALSKPLILTKDMEIKDGSK